MLLLCLKIYVKTWSDPPPPIFDSYFSLASDIGSADHHSARRERLHAGRDRTIAARLAVDRQAHVGEQEGRARRRRGRVGALHLSRGMRRAGGASAC